MGKLLAKYEDELASIKAEAIEIIDRADAEGRAVTDEEGKFLEEIKVESDRLNGLIEKEKGYREMRRSLAPENPGVSPEKMREDRKRADSRPQFNTLADMLIAVKAQAISGYTDPRLVPHGGYPTGHGERLGSDGGFLVSLDRSVELADSMYSLTRIAPLARTVEVGAGRNGLSVTHIDETSRVNGSRYGNVLAYWRGEADDLIASKIKFRNTEMKLEKITALLYATDELLEDAEALDSFVNDVVPEELAFRIDDAMIRGSGNGQPLGILEASDLLVSVPKETGQAAATINAENIKKMYARMWPSSLPNAVWLVNQDTLPQLWSLRDAGLTFPQVQTSLRETPPMTMLGRPVLPIEQAETLGTVGDIMFTDWRQYRVIRKGNTKIDSSIHVRYVQQETAFRFTIRINGQPIRQKALTPFRGANTISPFVVLATRA